MEQTMIKVTINGETREYPKMTPYSEIVKDYEGETEYPVILVTENGKLRELHKKLRHDCTLGFISYNPAERSAEAEKQFYQCHPGLLKYYSGSPH